jgi:hypothetical protein
VSEFKTIIHLDGVGFGKQVHKIDQYLGSEGVSHFIRTRISSCIEEALKSLDKRREEVENKSPQGDDFRGEFSSAQEAHEFTHALHRKSQEINNKRNLEEAKVWFRVAAVTAKVGSDTGELSYTRPLAPEGDPFVRLSRLLEKAEPGGLLIDTETFNQLPPNLQDEYSIEESISDKHNIVFSVRRWKHTYPIPTLHNLLLTDSFTLPSGWLLINQKFLDERRSLSPSDARRYFDGSSPRWREAIETNIPKMNIVNQLILQLQETQAEKRLGVLVMLGATSEGKTTALMQTVVQLIQENPNWNVIWNNGRHTFLNRSFVKQITQTNKPWLIVSDDAELIVDSVFEEVKFLYRKNNLNVQFLLCCRDTDWIASGADSWEWINYTNFNIKRLGEFFDENFAEKIITAWEVYGSLGKLQEHKQKYVMVQKLIEAAQFTTGKKGGTLLGAMLRVRYDNEGFKEHIQTLINRLRQIKAPGGSLLDAFAYIAFPHADVGLDGQKCILAQVLGCDENEVQRKIINRLGEEAATGSSKKFVFTRDPDIARCAVEIMLDSGDFDRETIYTKLVKSAFDVKKNGIWVDNIHDWQYLFSKFFEKGNEYHGLGTGLAQTVFENIVDKGAKLRTLVTLSRLYREAKLPDESVQVFRLRAENLDMDRQTYHEWGTAERRNKKPTLGAWLGGIAVSDQISTRLDKQTASICLSGLSTTFGDLYDKYNDRVFIEACGGAAQLGLTKTSELDAKSKTKKYLFEPDAESIRNLNRSMTKSKSVSKEQPLKNLERLQAGIIAAWEQPEDDLPECVTPANHLTFDCLARLLGVIR